MSSGTNEKSITDEKREMNIMMEDSSSSCAQNMIVNMILTLYSNKL